MLQCKQSLKWTFCSLEGLEEKFKIQLLYMFCFDIFQIKLFPYRQTEVQALHGGGLNFYPSNQHQIQRTKLTSNVLWA